MKILETRRRPVMRVPLLLAFLASILSPIDAQQCISLANSTQCPAFNSSSISTGSALSGQFNPSNHVLSHHKTPARCVQSLAGGPSSATNTSAAATGGQSSNGGLSGGQIAGIVVGAVVGLLLILALILLFCTGMLGRWRNRHQRQSVFNQPSPPHRGGQSMAFAPQPGSQTGQPASEPQPGGRVARMAALTGESSESPSYGNTTAVAGGRRYGDTSESEGYGETPESRLGGRPVASKRNGSLSSQSMLGAMDDNSSPNSGSGGQYSSPEGLASGQSEQLEAFKDYYSQDEIHPGDAVATLWAYEPRAGDEFELERGDMLKVVGIWDDGWATGIRLGSKAEAYEAKLKLQRDSGVSHMTGRRGSSPSPSGEVKAFPLVCVCLPEHWKSTVDGDGPEEPEAGNRPIGLDS
ncbi:MAG: hypothetical protein LQ348_000803 [Seirophora lacunosa]|nr:MAG: hypothetical protein LQ348_000803 [Seirophora lacunosa]